MLLALLIALFPAHADPGSRSGFDVGASEFEVDDDDDDGGMVDYAKEALKRPPESTHFHLDPTGKEAFGNDWPLHQVAANPDWVKLELPVLVATGREAFVAEHPGGVRVVGEWDVGGQTFRSEQIVTPEGVWAEGPTFAFLTLAVDDARKTAPVRLTVATADLPAPPVEGAEPPPPPAKPKVRYAVTSVFYRKGE